MAAKSIEELRLGQQKMIDDFNLKLENLQIHVDQSVDQVESQVALATAEMSSLKTSVSAEMASMTTNLTDVSAKVNSLEQLIKQLIDKEGKKPDYTVGASGSFVRDGILPPPNRNEFNDGSQRLALQFKLPKIDFPIFEGDAPIEWIRRCERYFQIHDVPERLKVGFAEMHLRGVADVWFGGIRIGNPHMTWQRMREEVLTRFSNKSMDMAVDEFHQLKQFGSVDEFLGEFEGLKSLVQLQCPLLSEQHYVNCFVRGLKPEIKSMVRMWHPESMSAAVELARSQECVILSLNHEPLSKTMYTSAPPLEYKPPVDKAAKVFDKLPQIEYKPPDPKPVLQRATTFKEMQDKRSKGLCFRCDEKYTPGHKCRQKYINLIVAEDEEFVEEDSQISVYALTGRTSPNTFKISGMIKKKPVVVLIDSGASHSLLDYEVAKDVGCYITPSNPMIIKVADGNSIRSESQCPGLKWTMQGVQFIHDIRLMKLRGCDMVLGVDWLSLHSPVTFDFKTMSLTLCKRGHEITLSGEAELGHLELISCTKMVQAIQKGTCALVGDLNQLQAAHEASHGCDLVDNGLEQPHLVMLGCIKDGQLSELIAEEKIEASSGCKWNDLRYEVGKSTKFELFDDFGMDAMFMFEFDPHGSPLYHKGCSSHKPNDKTLNCDLRLNTWTGARGEMCWTDHENNFEYSALGECMNVIYLIDHDGFFCFDPGGWHCHWSQWGCDFFEPSGDLGDGISCHLRAWNLWTLFSYVWNLSLM